jgi:hypothetical protein
MVSPVVMATATDLIICRGIDFGGGTGTERYLAAQLTTRCDGGSEYERGAVVAWMTLLLAAFGTPLLVVVVLWVSRRKVGARVTQALFAAIVEQYQEGRWYWDGVVRMWLTCFVLVLSLVDDAGYQALRWWDSGCCACTGSGASSSASVSSLALIYFLTYANITDAATDLCYLRGRCTHVVPN